MHEDICVTAAERRVAFLILPFHKHACPLDGVWEVNNPGLRNVLYAPCSVGILVDRGIGIVSLASDCVDNNVAVLFFGSPDDREAVVFGYSIAEHPGVKVKVFRFVHGQSKDHCSIAMPTDGDGRMNHGNGDGHSMLSRFSMLS